ncbi:unnamed protein product [Urochloa humidicola]
MVIYMASASGGCWYNDGRRRFSGGRQRREDCADGLLLLELLLEVGVPVVLDVIVSPLRELGEEKRKNSIAVAAKMYVGTCCLGGTGGGR